MAMNQQVTTPFTGETGLAVSHHVRLLLEVPGLHVSVVVHIRAQQERSHREDAPVSRGPRMFLLVPPNIWTQMVRQPVILRATKRSHTSVVDELSLSSPFRSSITHTLSPRVWSSLRSGDSL